MLTLHKLFKSWRYWSSGSGILLTSMYMSYRYYWIMSTCHVRLIWFLFRLSLAGHSSSGKTDSTSYMFSIKAFMLLLQHWRRVLRQLLLRSIWAAFASLIFACFQLQFTEYFVLLYLFVLLYHSMISAAFETIQFKCFIFYNVKI